MWKRGISEQGLARIAQSEHKVASHTKSMGSEKTYRVTQGFSTPPENQGQIVEVSYGYAPKEQVIIERVYDKSDRALSYRAYEDPDPEADFDPWNGTPKLGDDLGSCNVVEDDDY